MKAGDKVMLLKPYPHVRVLYGVSTFPDLGDGYKLAGIEVYYFEKNGGYCERDEFLTKEEIDAMFEKTEKAK